MPQHELWAASARPIGFSITYVTHEARAKDQGLLTVAPRWSKTPAGRSGFVAEEVPGYMVQDLPAIVQAAVSCWMWSLPGNVPGVVRSTLRQLQHEYSEGVRS